jgi:hypothetical protein
MGTEPDHVDAEQTDEPPMVVSCDQEVWLKDRIRTAIQTGITINQQKGVGADTRQIDDAIEGLVNGTAVEIINHLNLKTDGANLDLRRGRDNHLLDDSE